jgi:hypothetical protein
VAAEGVVRAIHFGGNSHPLCLQKEATMTTLTLDSVLSNSAAQPNGRLSALIVCMILIGMVLVRMYGGMMAPFKEIIKAALAALGALLLTGALVVMLITALMMSA